MRILFCHETDGAAQYRQRALTPAMGLTQLGQQVELSSLSAHPRAPDSTEVIRGLDERTGKLGGRPDVVVLRLLDQDESVSIRRARRNGQLVYVDLDDDVWAVPEWNAASRTLKRSGEFLYPDRLELAQVMGARIRSVDLDYLEANIQAATGVLCSTPAVAASVLEACGPVAVHVCRNGIDAGLYERPRPVLEHRPLRLGWMGAVQQGTAEALRDVAEGITAALEQTGAMFVHLGGSGPELAELLGIPLERFAYVPWAKSSALGAMLARIDVGMVCRRPGPFTAAQSNVSGLSFMAAGVPFAATNTAEYQRTPASLVLEHTAEAWHFHLVDLITHATRRARARELGYQQLPEHSPRAVARAYLDVFRDDREAARG